VKLPPAVRHDDSKNREGAKQFSNSLSCHRLLGSWSVRVFVVIATIGGPACAARHSQVLNDYGITHCPADAADHLLSVDALQCWFDAPHGRWRILNHDSHYAVLVVNVEALTVRDADAIARRFVGVDNGSFSEILVYVQPESRTGSQKVRRVRWERGGGFETLEFTASPPFAR